MGALPNQHPRRPALLGDAPAHLGNTMATHVPHCDLPAGTSQPQSQDGAGLTLPQPPRAGLGSGCTRTHGEQQRGAASTLRHRGDIPVSQQAPHAVGTPWRSHSLSPSHRDTGTPMWGDPARRRVSPGLDPSHPPAGPSQGARQRSGDGVPGQHPPQQLQVFQHNETPRSRGKAHDTREDGPGASR